MISPSVERSRSLAWMCSIGAAVLALVPALGGLRGAVVAYDGSLAVLTATLIALVWYTQFTFETLDHYRTRDATERIRARAVLATGVLSELEWLENRLEQMREHGPYSMSDPLEHPILEDLLGKAEIFGTATASRLARFHALLRDTRAEANAPRQNPDMFGDRQGPSYFEARKQFKFTCQAKAHFALAALPELVGSLVTEGGELPLRDQTVAIENYELPLLGASPFGPRRLPVKIPVAPS